MHKITAKHILVGNGSIIEDGVVVLDESGKIVAIEKLEAHDSASIRKIEGTIIPGLINTHCHLELSHLKDRIPTGTGLVDFITGVVQLRDVPQSEIDKAIETADANMFANGIQAVGDISNKSDTAKIKEKSPISYYTFVEYFDLMNPNITKPSIEQYNQSFEAQSSSGFNRKSKVPHAPYSVTPELFKYLTRQQKEGQTISIHNQETHSENEMFYHNTGKMVDFFSNIGMPIKQFPAKDMSSLAYALQFMNPEVKTLFVHNTICTQQDLERAKAWSHNIYFATCPNANLYIENALPHYKIFLDADVKMTIGTDSLSSNWQLSVWEEMKTIQKFQSYVSFDDMLEWATKNGAEALGYEDRLGTIEVGKSPGILEVDIKYNGKDTDISKASVKRIF